MGQGEGKGLRINSRFTGPEGIPSLDYVHRILAAGQAPGPYLQGLPSRFQNPTLARSAPRITIFSSSPFPRVVSLCLLGRASVQRKGEFLGPFPGKPFLKSGPGRGNGLCGSKGGHRGRGPKFRRQRHQKEGKTE